MQVGYYTYLHINILTSEVFYVGFGTKHKNKNHYARANSRCGRSDFWYNIVNKYGYRIEIAFESLNKEECLEKEQYLILKYGRRDLNTGTLVNLTTGGEHYEHSYETAKIISEKLKGNKNGIFQRRKTAKEKLEISIRMKNHYTNSEHHLLGKKLSKEWRDNISKANKGKIFTEKHKDNLKNKTFVKEIICLDTGKKYPSIIECIRDMFDGNIYKRKNIQQSIKKNTTYKGFKFKLI